MTAPIRGIRLARAADSEALAVLRYEFRAELAVVTEPRSDDWRRAAFGPVPRFDPNTETDMTRGWLR